MIQQRDRYWEMGMRVLGVACAVACFAGLGGTVRGQVVGEVFDIRAQSAEYDQSNAVTVFNGDDGELAVVYVREVRVEDATDTGEGGAPLTGRRDEVRVTIYSAGDMSVVADDVLVLRQNVAEDREGCVIDSMEFNNVDIAYNAFAGEYVVAAGGRINADNACPDTQTAPLDEGEIWVTRVATGTGAPIGETYYLNNGSNGNVVEEFVFGAEVAVAASTVNGNVLVAYGRGINGVGDTVVAGILMTPELAPLNTGGNRMGQDLGSTTAPPGLPLFLFALHYLHSNNMSYDVARREFMVPWLKQHTLSGVRFSSPDLHMRAVKDTVSGGGTLQMGPNLKVVQSDLKGNTTTSYEVGEGHEVVNRGFSKPIRNPYSESAETEFVIAYQWDALGTNPPNDGEDIDTEFPYDGLRLRFFGLDGAGALIDGPVAEVIALAETATEVRFPRLVAVEEREQFAVVWIDDLVRQQGYANNADWQAAPPEPAGIADTSNRDIKYVMTDKHGVRDARFGPAGETLRTGVDDLIDGSGDTPFATLVTREGEAGYLFASWEERTAEGEARHPVGVAIGMEERLGARGWGGYR